MAIPSSPRFDAIVRVPPRFTLLGRRIDPDTSLDALLDEAWRSAAGQGATTCFDRRVRDGWEIPARALADVEDAAWHAALDDVLAQASDALGLGGPVRATLDKLVIYPEGGHFRTHRDTLRASGHLGTLIVRWRAAERGGELVVGDTHPSLDPVDTGDGMLCTVLLADVPHEVRPVLAGVRVALTYQVHRAAPARVLEPRPASVSTAEGAVPDGRVALLRHRYADDALRAGALVGVDRALAEAWLAEMAPGEALTIAELQVRCESDNGVCQHTSLSLRHTLRGEAPQPWEGAPVALSPEIVALLKPELLPGKLEFFTGNEGTATTHRFRAAVLVRGADNPTGTLPDSESAGDVLEAAQAVALARAERMESHARALLEQVADVRSGTWLASRRAELAEHGVVDETSVATEDELAGVLYGLRPALDALGTLPQPPLDEVGPSWAHRRLEWPAESRDEELWHRRAPWARAALAESEGWRSVDDEVLLHATALADVVDVRLSCADSVGVLRNRGLTSLERLQVERSDADTLELPELPALRVLHLGWARGVRLGLHRRAQLHTLELESVTVDEDAPGSVERACLCRVTPWLPADVLGPALRDLEIVTSDDEPSVALAALGQAPSLRALSFEGSVSLEDAPWPQWTSLRALSLHHRWGRRWRNAVRARLRPGAGRDPELQACLDRLHTLSLAGLDLHGVELESLEQLRSLTLRDCVDVGSLPRGAKLRTLHVESVPQPLPQTMPRLEVLHLENADRFILQPNDVPRLRSLTLRGVRHVDLRALEDARWLLHLEVCDARELHLPERAKVPHVERIVLERVPFERMPALDATGLRSLRLVELAVRDVSPLHAPALEEVHLERLPLAALPEAWRQAPLREVFLDRLADLDALPEWIGALATLENLGAVQGRLEHLPSLAGLTALHTLHLWGQRRLVVDEALRDALLALPSLTTLFLTAASIGEHGDVDPRPWAQLREALERSTGDSIPFSEEDEPADASSEDEDDEIPF